MKLEYIGHSCFIIEDDKRILIDPFITGNPSASKGMDDMKGIDLVLVTHGHGDHLGDAMEIAIDNDATFVAMYELTNFAAKKGVKKVEPMNIGGTIHVDDVEITMTNALHSSDFEGGAGHAAGFIVSLKDHKVYHAGDTGVFYDMKLIGQIYKPDISILPIGSRFTMGIREATKAVELIGSEYVVPMHFGTYPALDQDPYEFKKKVGEKAKVIVLKPGESITF
ncbi:MAG TPA: metal-dependent hydrolase [Candidatus Methanofastidiosa archaeon]|nr:metal-dependent hydrolase [Candidatus Methanofastidiosa archaeon]HPR41908.1 metal-dependent hydrolase [Candidatus Methanofastidiosa archaeon]